MLPVRRAILLDIKKNLCMQWNSGSKLRTYLCTHASEGHKLSEGKIISLERRFTFEDVESFCQLFPISDLTLKTEPVVPELLYAGLFPAIIGTHFPGSVYISQHLDFRSNLLIGDNVLAEVKAVNLRSFRNKYRVEFLTSCWKKEGNILLIEGNAIAILPSLAYNGGKHQTV